MDISKLTPRALQVLQAVLREENVSRAAATLGIPQPVVSATLSKLRITLADELVIRGNRGVMLTEKARRLKPIVSRIVSDLQWMIEDSTFEPETASFTFTFSCTDYVQSTLMPGILHDLATHAPHARFAVRNLDRQHIHNHIEDDITDMAVMPSGNAPESLRAMRLLEEAFVVVGKKGSLPDKLDLDWYCAQSHIITEPSHPHFSGQVDRSLHALDRRREVVCSVQSFLSSVQLVGASSMIATVPGLLAVQHQTMLDIRPPPLPVEGFNLSAVWDSRYQNSPRHQWVRNRVKTSMANLTK